MRRWLLAVVIAMVAAVAVRTFLDELFPRGGGQKAESPSPRALPAGVPTKVAAVLAHVDKTGEALDGYEGGQTFGNFERLLPDRGAKGRPIKYREWDVNPLKPGVNRGAERMVTGSDGSAYYTSDHYKSFKKIR